jgi:hypothetical protein
MKPSIDLSRRITLMSVGFRTNALQVNLMPIDDNRRAVLTIASLTHLSEMKRKIGPNDASGLVVIEILERMVINGTVADRDGVLKLFDEHESFDWYLAAEAV